MFKRALPHVMFFVGVGAVLGIVLAVGSWAMREATDVTTVGTSTDRTYHHPDRTSTSVTSTTSIVTTTTEALPPAPPTTVVTASPATTTTVRPTTTTTVVVHEEEVGPTEPTVVEEGSDSEGLIPPATLDVKDIIREVFGSRFGWAVAEQAVRVAGCETGGTYNPAVTSGSHTGLFQISWRWHSARVLGLGYTREDLKDPWINSLVAADIYGESGWGPWTCRYRA